MNIPDLYKDLEVEPSRVSIIEQIKLTARIVDPIHFVFIPEYWEAELKPYRVAKWKHEKYFYSLGARGDCPNSYEIKSGVLLAFPQFNMTQGGFYAAHLYKVVKELGNGHVRATLTVEGLTLEAVEQGIKARVHLKPRGLSVNDTAYYAVLGYW